MKQPILQLRGICKRFGSTVALDGVDLDVYPGEIRGLIGENGSGKSTISSIAAGMQKADEGTMRFRGQSWAPASMIDALEHGVGMIVQESGTIPGITVAENLFLAETAQFCRFGMVSRKAMNAKADEALDAVGIRNVRGSTPLGALDFQTRKLVEIAKVAMKSPEILVVDETTTALSHDGRQLLYQLTRRYRDEGKAVIFISHDLEEIMEVCDTLTVLRDGKLIRTFEKAEFDSDQIRTSMIGRELQGDYYRSDSVPSRREDIALEAEHVTIPGELEDVSLKLHKGEIIGVGGLSQCGMHTLGKVFFGAAKPQSGAVRTGEGKAITDEASAMALGLGYVAKDRDVESLSLSASIQDNIAIAGMDRYAVNSFLILEGKERAYVDEQIKALSVKCAGREQPVSQLSGGNKQKVVFGKWIGRGSEVLILDCPTRGVDIGVKQAMYQLMTRLKEEGKSILMISEELPELLGMSDRIVMMKDGKITQEFERSPDLTDAQLIGYMI